MSGPADGLRSRIADQFSYRGERADVWRAFDLLLETDAYLNLGYSARYQTHLVGSSQRRLADRVAETVATHLPPGDAPLLDVGCGRGGPAVRLAERLDRRVVGVDLVPYNVRRATANAGERGVDAQFVVGDATELPLADGSVAACTAVDALVYLPDRPAVFAAVRDALDPDGPFVFSDLVAASDLDERERRRVDAFADAWDMPQLGTVREYRRQLTDAGLPPVEIRDLTPHSVGRFRRWTTLFLRARASPLWAPLAWSLERYGVDPDALAEQVRRAHDALPHLRHVLVVAGT